MLNMYHLTEFKEDLNVCFFNHFFFQITSQASAMPAALPRCIVDKSDFVSKEALKNTEFDAKILSKLNSRSRVPVIAFPIMTDR